MGKVGMHMKPALQKIKNVEKKTWLIWFEILILLFICILHGISAGHYVNFSPINGSFQNFNPVRRLLDGQVPYRDFQDYLGMGHLYVGVIGTVLFGGNYQASLMAFSFWTLFSFALLWLVLSYSVFKDKLTSVSLSNIILVLLIMQPFFVKNILSGIDGINSVFEAALKVGNSARFVRGMILPISCILFQLAHAVYQCVYTKRLIVREHAVLIKLCGVGLIAGFSFVWGNDYGISGWLCLLIMTFILIFARVRKLGQALLGATVSLASSLVSIFLLVEIFTLGHFVEWFSSIFGTGGYQGWYYNSDKSFYLFQVDFSYIMLVQATLCIAYLVALFVSHGSREAIFRYGIPAFCNMTAFCAVNEYRMLSGGNAREFAIAVLFVTVSSELCQWVKAILIKEKGRELFGIIASLVGMVLLVSSTIDEVSFWNISNKEGEYVEAMGGNMTSLYKDLKNTSEFLKGDSFFATYASAQEVVEGKFQPSGTDYIIHVLGDSQRAVYLESFKNNDFRYVATMKAKYTEWEYWVQRANWFFYRELYRNWHPVYANSYELYWERNEEGEDNVLTDVCTVTVQEIDESTVKIIVTSEDDICGIADVYIDYEVKKKDRILSKLLFTTMLKVENSGTVYADDPYYESINLRACNAEYIPITVVNGYGEAVLTSMPSESTYLELNSVSRSDVYPVVFEYIEATGINIGEGGALIHVGGNARNRNRDILENITGVIVNDKLYAVSEIRENEDGFDIVIPINESDMELNEVMIKNHNVLQVTR